MTISFLFTIIPFYLGACRYQDKTYFHKNVSHSLPRYIPLFDFIFFFIEAILFYLMSLFVSKPKEYTALFATLLFWDFIWLVIIQKMKIRTYKEIKLWLKLNISCAPILVLLVVFVDKGVLFIIIVAIISIGRTLIDFVVDKEFYFQKSSN